MIEAREILDILPHRYPMLLVDRVLDIEEGKRIVAIKNVTRNEPFFDGHFPGNPIMPGVMMLEAMAQTAGILLLRQPNLKGKLAFFAAMEDVRFRKPVLPGDQLRMEIEILKIKGPIAKVSAKGFVDGKLVVEAEQTFSLMDQPTKTQIESTAFIHPSAELGKDVYIGPYATIGEGVKIGDGTRVEAHAVVEKWTEVGKNCHIHYGAVIGSESQDKKHMGEKSFVKIGDNNVFREYVTINRATGEGDATIIGNDNLLLSYVHVGHDCVLGNGIVISNSTGIAGHCIIEDKVVMGGMVGITQFVRIGTLSMIGGYSKVNQDIPPYMLCEGNPAVLRTVNLIGLQRSGLSPEQVRDVKKAYRFLYRSELNISQAVDKITQDLGRSATLDRFVGFLAAPSKVGICKRSAADSDDDAA